MNISETILEELKRYNNINNYITEQDALADVPPPPGGDVPPAPEGAPPVEPGATPTPEAPATTEPTPVDVAADPDVEKIGEEGENDSEELEITDLVKSQQNIESKQDEYFNNLFTQLSNLEQKLSDMDSVMEKLNNLEAKIDEYRPKTPQEKLELRSLDSGPFNQKLTDFFTDKQEDMEKSGKNEYVLTTDEVEDFTPSEIKNTFSDYADKGDFRQIKY